MALINCPECNKEVSDKASACIGCGCPLKFPAESADNSDSTEESTTESTSVVMPHSEQNKGTGISPGEKFAIIALLLIGAATVGIVIFFNYITTPPPPSPTSPRPAPVTVTTPGPTPTPIPTATATPSPTPTPTPEVGPMLESTPEPELISASSLVGAWDWGGMTGAITLRDNGRFSWLGVDYGVLGFRWSSHDGLASFAHVAGGISTAWFSYQFIDNNTINIEYTATPGIIYTLHRTTSTLATELETELTSVSSLVGAWNWEGMAGAIILRDYGGFSWLGVDYGAIGFRWSSRNGVVSFSLDTGGVLSAWFNYQFIDDNTINIEYTATPGIIYTLHRATPTP